jgi:hypothetical protein
MTHSIFIFGGDLPELISPSWEKAKLQEPRIKRLVRETVFIATSIAETGSFSRARLSAVKDIAADVKRKANLFQRLLKPGTGKK